MKTVPRSHPSFKVGQEVTFGRGMFGEWPGKVTRLVNGRRWSEEKYEVRYVLRNGKVGYATVTAEHLIHYNTALAALNRTPTILEMVNREISEHRAHSNGDMFSAATAAAIAKGLMSLGDKLTAALTSAKTLNELTGEFEKHGYRPTIRTDMGPAYEALANLYDYTQECRHIDARCYRGATP